MLPGIRAEGGMNFWKIFVLGMLRLNCNVDFDKLYERPIITGICL
jgi:hypothetical protein